MSETVKTMRRWYDAHRIAWTLLLAACAAAYGYVSHLSGKVEANQTINFKQDVDIRGVQKDISNFEKRQDEMYMEQKIIKSDIKEILEEVRRTPR